MFYNLLQIDKFEHHKNDSFIKYVPAASAVSTVTISLKNMPKCIIKISLGA